VGRFGRKDAPRVVGFDFAPPVPPPAPPAYAAEPWGVTTAAPPQPWGAPGPMTWQPIAKKRGRRSPIALAVVVGLLSVGRAVAGFVEHRPLHTPGAVGGYARMHSTVTDTGEEQVRLDMRKVDKLVVATYGDGTVPRYMLIAGNGSETTTDEVFDGFASGWSASPGGIDVRDARAMGANVKCVAITFGKLPGTACAWGGGRSDGMIVAFGTKDFEQVAQATTGARSALEG
jgi:hypothetical protein